MSRKFISAVLTSYFLSVVLAGLVRFDEFPLTWVPMYSTYIAGDLVTIPQRNKSDLSSGLVVTHRDGAQSRVTARMLNVPARNYWRIHLQRVAGKGPAKYAQARMNLSPLNRLLWRESRDPMVLNPVEWNKRILVSLNKTLGFQPEDPQFIIRATAPATHVTIDKNTMKTVEIRRVTPTVAWEERWGDEWERMD